MPNIGPLELIVLLVIVLLVFGPKRLPGLGKQLGGGMREFKESLTSRHDDDDDDDRPALKPAATETPAPAATTTAETPAPTKAPDTGV